MIIKLAFYLNGLFENNNTKYNDLKEIRKEVDKFWQDNLNDNMLNEIAETTEFSKGLQRLLAKELRRMATVRPAFAKKALQAAANERADAAAAKERADAAPAAKAADAEGATKKKSSKRPASATSRSAITDRKKVKQKKVEQKKVKQIKSEPPTSKIPAKLERLTGENPIRLEDLEERSTGASRREEAESDTRQTRREQPAPAPSRSALSVNDDPVRFLREKSKRLAAAAAANKKNLAEIARALVHKKRKKRQKNGEAQPTTADQKEIRAMVRLLRSMLRTSGREKRTDSKKEQGIIFSHEEEVGMKLINMFKKLGIDIKDVLKRLEKKGKLYEFVESLKHAMSKQKP